MCVDREANECILCDRTIWARLERGDIDIIRRLPCDQDQAPEQTDSLVSVLGDILQNVQRTCSAAYTDFSQRGQRGVAPYMVVVRTQKG